MDVFLFGGWRGGCVPVVTGGTRWYVQASMELGLEEVSLLERCPHFRGWYVQASIETPHLHHTLHVPVPQYAHPRI